MSWHEEAKEIEQRRKLSKGQGGAESIARHHAKGRLTIRERIDALVAPDSFEEHGEGAGFAEKMTMAKSRTSLPLTMLWGLVQLAVKEWSLAAKTSP